MKSRLFIFTSLIAFAVCAIMSCTALAQKSASAQRPNAASQEILSIDGTDYYVHHVAAGENLTSLARLYGVRVSEIIGDNAVLFEGMGPGQVFIEPGQVLKIRCLSIPVSEMSRRRYNRTFEEHIVMSGETAYSISRRYLLPLHVLVEDNPGLDPAVLRSGQRLRIRRAEKGESSPEAIMKEAGSISNTLNRLSEDYFYHLVESGETIYSLSRRWGIEKSVILENNYITADNLLAGTILKVPAQGLEELKYRLVEVPLDPFDPQTTDGRGDDKFQDDTGGYDPSRHNYYGGVLRIAMLLPLSGSGQNFVEFYQGALLALEDIKTGGHSVDFDLYDTARSPEKTAAIVQSGELDGAHFVIGPVYEEEFGIVYEYMQRRRVPLISPLSSLEGSYDSSVYQMPPSQQGRYDKMGELFEGDKNIVIVASGDNDDEFERDMLAIIGRRHYQRVIFDDTAPSQRLEEHLKGPQRTETVFVITSRNENHVRETLGTISSIYNNRKARSMSMPAVRVVGNSRWLRYPSVDRNWFFKLNVTFSTSYHCDRSNEAVYNFDKRYLEAFGTVPSPFAYRGYDAVTIFAEALFAEGVWYSDFTGRLNSTATPLQTGYSFRSSERGFIENSDWPLVKYKDDYTIEVR